VLSFSWVAIDAKEQVRGINDTTLITSESFASSSQEILDSTSTVSFTLAASTTEGTTSSQVESNKEPDTTPPAEPNTENIPTQSELTPESVPSTPATDISPPTSYFYKTVMDVVALFFERVYAQDEATTENTNHETETISEVTEATSTKDDPVLTDEFLEVLYSFDGSHWESLGYVGVQQFAHIQFVIPLQGIETWEDMNTLQIKVKSLPKVDMTPVVYLDGVTLEVSYKDGIKKTIKGNPVLSSTLGDQTEKIKVASKVPNSYLAIYSIDKEKNASYVIGLEVPDDGRTTIDLSTLSVGDYVIVGTLEPGICNAFLLDDCRKDEYYIGESSFEVKDPDAARKTQEALQTIVDRLDKLVSASSTEEGDKEKQQQTEGSIYIKSNSLENETFLQIGNEATSSESTTTTSEF
jgi:hypothetical protein